MYIRRRSIPSGPFNIVSVSSGLVLGLQQKPAPTPGTIVTVVAAESSTVKWQFNHQSADDYTIQLAGTNLYMAPVSLAVGGVVALSTMPVTWTVDVVSANTYR
ncbi:hypothetical protein TWF694_002658 [Orbilia ellipsospora]|uniref:Uncharacterized protein n=1 Tax=Orbilia ellipsospora TaxID=2528407 RepID=A0AAV9X3Z9_9PEZI